MKAIWSIMFILVTEPPLAYFFTINTEPGSFSQEIEVTINASQKEFLVFSNSTTSNPYRIHTWSVESSLEEPVLVVVLHDFQALSWTIPFNSDNSSSVYNISRTLCHNNLSQKKNLSETFAVGLSTSSPTDIKVIVLVTEVIDFFVKDNVNYEIHLTPTQPNYFLYTFSNDESEVVAVEVNSADNLCLTVSIQENHCPVLDLNRDVTYEGEYQTVKGKGGMRIERDDYPDGFFLIFVAKFNDSDCTQKQSLLKESSDFYNVKFSIVDSLDSDSYVIAIWVVVGAITGFCICAVVLVCIFDKLIKDATYGSEDFMKDKKKETTVTELSTKTERNDRKSTDYLYHIGHVAIFYGIPVVQLVVTYRRVMNETGNEDLCYYNFLCANPLGIFGDFNHFFSNIGYVILGILFLGIVFYRNKTFPSNKRGVPVHYGIFYSMGVALIMEGVLSACYHVCPNEANFQFDTSFMYVIAVLCMVKLYENRHSDKVARAYSVFGIIGFITFVVMVGIVSNSAIFAAICAGLYIILMTVISLKIYFNETIAASVTKFSHKIKKGRYNPSKKSRFVLILLGNIINYISIILFLYFYFTGSIDIGTFFLGLLMINSIMYAAMYTVMKKCVYREPVGYQVITYGVLSFTAWIGSAIFYFDASTEWSMSAAQSRLFNQQCVFLDFYDNHDIWHLLSACALYLTFMCLLCLDDSVMNVERNKLYVF